MKPGFLRNTLAAIAVLVVALPIIGLQHARNSKLEDEVETLRTGAEAVPGGGFASRFLAVDSPPPAARAPSDPAVTVPVGAAAMSSLRTSGRSLPSPTR